VFEGTSPSGYIRVSDLVKALSTYGADVLESAEAEELVGQLEVDSNGLFNYESFVDVMMTSSGAGAGAGAGGGTSGRARGGGSVTSGRRGPDGRGAIAAVTQAKKEKAQKVVSVRS